MNREQQDRLWNELSEESKEVYRKVYKKYIDQMNATGTSPYYRGKAEASYEALYDIFGEHNLNPKPQIKTWEDVERIYPDTYGNEDMVLFDFNEFAWDVNFVRKCIATLKLSKLIDLGYGGVVSEEEWKDEESYKYVILPSLYEEDGFSFNDILQYRDRQFIAFHTPEQREEFWSYESNRKLVELYYLL